VTSCFVPFLLTVAKIHMLVLLATGPVDRWFRFYILHLNFRFLALHHNSLLLLSA
jgi:UDP-galactopyranose mutase